MGDDVETLFKYVTSERALTCIPEVGDGTLRATQPASLNDPFECAVIPVYVISKKSEENRELAEVLTKLNSDKIITEEDVRLARNRYGSLFTRQLLTEQASTRFGIVSFTKNNKHPLMWSHYTIDGSGFVIGYDIKELKKIRGDLKPVKYDKTPPLITGPIVLVSPESNISDLLAQKSNHWEYENEWRLIIELNKTIGTGSKDHHGQPINLVQIPNEAIVCVYYTERTPHDYVDLIRSRLSDNNNRYMADRPIKLTLSSKWYEYEEEVDTQ